MLPIDQLPGTEGRLCLFERVPRGPIAAIAPFNFPINLVAHKLSPALALGAPTVLKPAQQSPLTAHALGQWLLEAGMPGPLLSVLHMPPQVAEKLVTDERMAVLSFTGSDSLGFSFEEHRRQKVGAARARRQRALRHRSRSELGRDRAARGGGLLGRTPDKSASRPSGCSYSARCSPDFVERFVSYSERVVCGGSAARRDHGRAADRRPGTSRAYSTGYGRRRTAVRASCSAATPRPDRLSHDIDEHLRANAGVSRTRYSAR